MATRYYPATQRSNVLLHGPCAGTWQQGVYRPWTPVQDQFMLSRSKTTSGLQSTLQFRTNQQPNYDFYWTRWITPALQAQDLTGTFDLCFGVQARWDDHLLFLNDTADVRYKLHVYLAQGQTYTVRTVLVDNYVDGVTFPGTSGFEFRSLATAQALATAHAEAGDVIVVEMGFRVVSAPPGVLAYPPNDTTRIDLRSLGAAPASADAVAGDAGVTRAPWFQFSMTLLEQTAPAAPANDTCVDAIVIDALPFQSDAIDTSQSAEVDHAVWWRWTAEADGFVFFHSLGSNTRVTVNAYEGTCGVFLTDYFHVDYLSHPTDFSGGRSQGFLAFDVVAGTTYLIRVASTGTIAAGQTRPGGSVRLGGFYRQAPAGDDLYLPTGMLAVYRDGQPVNLTADLAGSKPTGIAFDYTGRAMVSIDDDSTHTSPRVLMALHDFELVEILDAATLNLSTAEIDYIGDAWTAPAQAPAQLYCTAAGRLYVGWFGNGYLYVAGQGTSLVALLNAASSNPVYATVRSLEATAGDNQAAAPFADTVYAPDVEVTAPWAIAVDEANAILYYTSGGFYIPVGGQLIKRFDLANNVQLPDFASLTLVDCANPGLKGFQLLPGGGLLVCNGPVVQRLDAGGAVVTTYTPSIPGDAQTLTDVKLTTDGLRFWTIDLETTRLFLFTLATGAEVATYQTWGSAGSLVQMAIYQPEGIVPPVEVAGCDLERPSTSCWAGGSPSLQCIDLSPVRPSSATWAPTYSVDALRADLLEHDE